LCAASFVVIQWGKLGIVTVIVGSGAVGLCRYVLLAVLA
jgi:hypothetical protein